MITWEKRPKIVANQDPAHLISVLTDLEESEGWKWLCRQLHDEADNHKRRAASGSIESNPNGDGFNFQTILDVNRNIFTAKTLECVTEIIRPAKAMCQELIRKTEK
jgi:hypothetical protein